MSVVVAILLISFLAAILVFAERPGCLILIIFGLIFIISLF